VKNEEITWKRIENNLMLSYSAYCEEPFLKNWTCYWCNSTMVKEIKIFQNSSTNIYGYTGIYQKKSKLHKKIKKIQKSCCWLQRNSNSKFDKLDQQSSRFNFLSTSKYSKCKNSSSLFIISQQKGFYLNYLSVRSQILPMVRILTMKYPNYPILLTGHSLGAALSDLCAVDLFLNNFKKLELFLFGSPRSLNFLSKLESWEC
jgi:hypothetical protein